MTLKDYPLVLKDNKLTINTLILNFTNAWVKVQSFEADFLWKVSL